MISWSHVWGQVSMITRGVRVSASVIFLPDDPLMSGGRYTFAYRQGFMLQHYAHYTVGGSLLIYIKAGLGNS